MSDARELLNLRNVDRSKWSSEEMRRLFALVAAVADGKPDLTPRVRRLVIAAREFWDIHDSPVEIESRELDQALEAFSAEIPYAEEPRP
jgi:hypothetical protein